MTFQRENESNSPREPQPNPEWPDIDIRSSVSRRTIRQFREQMHALGALWIIIGSVAIAAAGFALQGNVFLATSLGAGQQVLLLILVSLGVLRFMVGVLTCVKQMWAVYV